MVRELADDGINVAVACRILRVSRSGYYDWRGRPPSARAEENELLLKHIQRIHDHSRGTYGWPRIHAELTLGLGENVNHKRVRRLMREAGLQGLYRRRRRSVTTIRNPHDTPATDLVNRRFRADGPNRLWLTDITEHPTTKGNCTAQRSWTPILGASSDGRSPSICAPNW